MLTKELIDQWLAKQNKRVELGKLKPASLDAFTSYANNWISPRLGELELETIKNGRVKEFAEGLVAAGKAPKTVREILMTLKSILLSHRNQDGEALLDLSKWNLSFITEDIPSIGKQNQPTISRDALNAILKHRSIKVRDRVLIGLGASTGLRIGELLALKICGTSDNEDTVWDRENRVILVRKSVYRGQLQLPNTLAAIRAVDLSTPVQNMLIEFAKGRQFGEFVFANKTGKPLDPSHVQRFITKKNGVPGAHALRRYRLTWLEEQGCPRGLEAFWMGHSNGDMRGRYDKTAEDREFRRKQVERIGTGLELSVVFETGGLPKPRRVRHATLYPALASA
jgi:integrase